LNAWVDFLAARKRDPGRNAGPLDTIADSADARSELERHIEDGFDAELLDMAMHRVRKRVKAGTWQAFHLTAVEGLSGVDAAQKLLIPVAHVFVAKNRVQKMLQKEARILRNGQR
jgi:DNA-directed RNA polymerase specialized sigma24 family protein